MNRADLQKLATIRIREAKILLDAGEYSGAYYLSGYAVECALKACFAKNVKRYDFPDRDGAGKVFTHKFRDLIKLAGLEADLEREVNNNTRFRSGWVLVSQWTEHSRYDTWTKADSAALIEAIVQRKEGVLPWIKQRW